MSTKSSILQKLESMLNKGTGSSAHWSVPKEGKATIRMFPYPYSEDPFLEYYFHFNIGRQSILCPVKNGLGSSCPLCQLAGKLYNSTDPSEKELSKKIYAKPRYYGAVVDRADETKTAKYWGFSKTIAGTLVECLKDDERKDFLDPKEGLDLTVWIDNTSGKQFPSAAVQTKMRSTPLASSDKEIQDIIKSLKPASEVFTVLSAEEIEKKLVEWLNSEGQAVDEQAQAESVNKDDDEGTAKGNTKPKRKANNTQDVQALFDELEEQVS